MLSKHVRWVCSPGDLRHDEVPRVQALLHPEVCNGDVSHLSKPSAAAYAYCRRGIALHIKATVNTEFESKGL